MHPDYIPGTPEHAEWVKEQLVKNKRASANFARRQFRIGRPVPRSATDLRPDPGTIENDETLIDG